MIGEAGHWLNFCFNQVTAEFSTYVPDDWKAPEGEAQLPRSLVTTKVKLPGGTSTVQLQAPKQPDCCLVSRALARLSHIFCSPLWMCFHILK